MKEEILRILKMVEEGKLDAEKAYDMLEIIQKKSFSPTEQQNKGRILRILVSSSNNDEVKISLPIEFIKSMIKATGPKFIQKIVDQSIQRGIENITHEDNDKSNFQNIFEGVDINMVLSAIESGLVGEIVNIQSSNGDKVYIGIE
ncbi:hypothetical protein B0S90_0506 [Caldicellulosiruptor bescii]|uniref:YvlB/LiaX N-terminal domain-containing protein n=2 Tax=Caldicellulosiruptor bescii TaxID=31899 RepID=B9MMF4_CALBD|nr:hypothetical protein [Caldicellulosiruptor bescii]ACM59386.1 conserved hypothetical protein [Caldicellulosiruptor bescii DSM 6725]PBC88157.1 hypothetical protein B0S87_1119 [Caldicellulosiruptor bescii]PBC89748.1 hypothetical protein B0S89_0010 [Caldicellulosiruptor bescii]PBD04827.1 hypothetical protein B0S85_2535 [Caldicellulosiruptor bescii]PBD05543.1 hypothetical protein B0S90_0506 [Caldicellulosiruptor bescii]